MLSLSFPCSLFLFLFANVDEEVQIRAGVEASVPAI